jgi:hydroxymethylpyrimidine/phosphomethylpyrimidine kinase
MKVVLTIAGSDSSGGAGVQADLKTFEAFGVFGTSAITVLTAQNTTGVRAVEPLPLPFIQAQLEAIIDDFEIAAVKVGMLYNPEIIALVGRFLAKLSSPIIIDPVSISKVGSPLLQKEALAALPSLFKYATLITPNQYEAQQFFSYVQNDEHSLKTLATYPVPILLKHQTANSFDHAMSFDQLFEHGQGLLFSTPLVQTTNLHGTGCSYSSAIAANLALGKSLYEAIEISKNFIYEALKTAPAIGYGAGPINHKQGGENVR